MTDPFWRPNDEQRRTILLLEALGIIHDLGKLCDRFLESQEPDSKSSKLKYEHTLLADPRRVYRSPKVVPGESASDKVQEWLRDADSSSTTKAFEERSDLTAVLEKVQFTDWSGQTYSFAELAPLVAKPGLANKSHNWQDTLGKEMQPGLLIGRLHGVAHIEKEGGPDQNKQPYHDVFRATPFGFEDQIKTGPSQELTDALKALPLTDIEDITSEKRSAWLIKMRAQMRQGLADNRRPHNEISLWDWGFIVATMTKAAAAWIFKNGWPTSIDHVPICTLRINLNRLERYMHCDKISDLLGVRKVLDESFEKVQKLLEETYALGNCLYHDETGAYYLFPDLNYGDEELSALRQEIQMQFPIDLQPQVHLSQPIKVGDLDKDKALAKKLIAEPRQQALGDPFIHGCNNLQTFESEWNEDRPENAEICTVCGMRPVGYPVQGLFPQTERILAPWATQDKAQKRNVCRICLDRRGRRAQDWVERNLQGTIWTNEVADDNGRLALFVGRLGLEGWLDGSLLSTIQVTDKANKIPSPTRLYRIVETARRFWERVIDDLVPNVVVQRSSRLALFPAAGDYSELGDFHAYELNVDGVSLSVVWDTSKNRFLTADNLSYFATRLQVSDDELADRLSRRTFEVQESSEFGQAGRTLLEVQIKCIEILDSYRPTIPILAEPSLSMILVPANKALPLAQAVKREYETQMGKVRDRLPLHLGLVFAPRRTPIRAVLDAGRAMLSMVGSFDMDAGTGWEGWKLVSKVSSGLGECELKFDNGIIWKIPITAGDCKTPDDWYPRMFEGDTWASRKGKHTNTLRVRPFGIPADKGWRLWVRPSRFDFEFLDTTARRFDIHYDADGQRPRRTRPFYLEDLDRLEKLWEYMRRLAKSQRYQTIHTIEATRETWYGQDVDGQSVDDEVFRQFVADTLAGATWPKGQGWNAISEDDRKRLVEAGVSGKLTDWAELHMKIMNE